MYYTVYHVTRFRYNTAISESIMKVHIQPRSEGSQRCLDFRLSTSPRAQIMNYRDELGNRVHHFDVPNRHTHLTITADAIVEMITLPELPEALPATAWEELDAMTANDEYWDMLKPSHFAHPSELLSALMRDLDVQRRDDPLSVLRTLNTAIYQHFEYAKHNTRADSPIDEALSIRRGVCPGFRAHYDCAGARATDPCRYVSGYLFQQSDDPVRTEDGATHAWVEVLLPDLNWIGFDPTNNILAGERHIRIAVGRDYADVPPTNGVFRGTTESELSVTVKVYPTAVPPPSADLSLEADWIPTMQQGLEYEDDMALQHAQQQ